MRWKHEARISVQLILILAVLSLLWSSLSLIHARIFPHKLQSNHDESPLQSCSKDEGNRSEPLRTGKETQAILGPVLEDDYIQQWQNGTKPHDMNALSALGVTTYIREIMGEGNSTTWRMQCSKSIPARYDSLQATTEGDGRIQFLFALDLYQAIPVLPTLLGSIIQVIRFLGPNRCAVSVVEGRSTDGTYQVLAALQDEIERLGVVFYLSTSDVSPQDGKQDRFERPSISKEPGVGAIGHGKSEVLARCAGPFSERRLPVSPRYFGIAVPTGDTTCDHDMRYGLVARRCHGLRYIRCAVNSRRNILADRTGWRMALFR